MPRKQSHQQYPCRIAIYVSETMKTWVDTQAGTRGISVSQFVANVLKHQFNSTQRKTMIDLQQYIAAVQKHPLVEQIEQCLERGHATNNQTAIETFTKLLEKCQGATQTVYEFPNGFVAEVRRGKLLNIPDTGHEDDIEFEIKYYKKNYQGPWEIVIDTEIGDSLFGRIGPKKRDEILQNIFAFPPATSNEEFMAKMLKEAETSN